MRIVKQGDCLSSIANQYGFFLETIWDHGRNAGLREQRRDPDVIMAGERVFVPGIRPREESGETPGCTLSG